MYISHVGLVQYYIDILRIPNLLSEREVLQRTTSMHIPHVFPSLLHRNEYLSGMCDDNRTPATVTFVLQTLAPFPAHVTPHILCGELMREKFGTV